MKNIILKLIRALGYDIKKLNPTKDVDIYKQCFNNESLVNRRFYNIGAGNFHHPYWTNVDFYSDWYKKNNKTSLAGINHDLMSLKKLPIDSDSAEVVYSSHTVEHITNAAAQKMFDEAYRILKKGGILRVTTPNINWESRAFKQNDMNFY